MSEIIGVTNNSVLPSATSNGTNAVTRLAKYGDIFGVPTDSVKAQLGELDRANLFIIRKQNLTASTATIQSTFNATNCFFTVRNAAPIIDPLTPKIYPLWFRMICNVVPASATRIDAAITLDNIVRYASGGVLDTPASSFNCNRESGVISKAIAHSGAVTLAAASQNVRVVSRMVLSSTIPVIYDVIDIVFSRESHHPGLLGGTVGSVKSVSAPSISLGPGNCMNLHIWYPSGAATAGQFIYEFAYMEQ
jgi:hypothetical protein